MAHGPSPAGGTGGPARPPRQPTPAAAASPLMARVALAALLVAVVLAGTGAAIPRTSWTDGPWHAHGTPLGIGLELVLAALLFAAERQRRRLPSAGQPASGLRVVLRAVLITGLVAIPVLILVNAAGRLRPATRRPPILPAQHGLHRLPLGKAPHGSPIDLAPVLYAVLAVALLAAIVACVILIRRRGRAVARAHLGPAEDDESQEQLRRAVESGQAALQEIDDARLAIIACYAAMEQSLAQAGTSRGDAETPDELLDRAAAAGLVHGGEASRLTALFYEARYSTHPVPDERRHEARRALQVLAAGLSQRPEQEPAGGTR